MSPAPENFIALEEAWLDDLGEPWDTCPKDLARAIAELLHRPHGGPGYAILRGSTADLSLDRARAFQVAMLSAVWQEMIVRQWVAYGPDEVRLNEFEANDGQLPQEIVGDVVTFKRLHFDPFSLIFAHLYEPGENLTGGSVSLVDVKSYLDDSSCRLSDAFEPLHAPGHNGRLVATEEHRQLMLQMYARTVEPPAPGDLLLVVIRNDPVVGVAHEIAEVRSLNPGLPTKRRFYRTSIAPHH